MLNNGQSGGDPNHIAQSTWDAVQQWLQHIGDRMRKLETMETANGAQAVPSVAFADLPVAAAHTGWVVFVTDGLKDGEVSGTGTGCLGYCDGSGWFRSSDDTPVAV